jgi:hypothetical protein
MRAPILGLELGPILAWGSSLSCWRGSRPVKTAIAFETAQDAESQAATATPQPGGIVASIQQDNGLGWQLRNQACQLLVRYLDGRGLRRHPSLIENVGPTTGWLCQDHHRRKLPSKGDRFLAFRQVMHVLSRTICRSYRIRTGNTRRINSQPKLFAWLWLRKGASKDFAQALFINAPLFKRFIQAGPFALKPQRLRDFGKRFRLRFCHQSIDRVEKRIFAALETLIDIVTKLSQCVKVHSVNFLWLLMIGTLLDQARFRKGGGPFV